jgi:dienelactone hydrolase
MALLPSLAVASCKAIVQQFTMPDVVDQTSFTIKVWNFSPNAVSRNVVLILPGIGGESFLDQRLARNICKKGAQALVLDVVKHYDPNYVVRNLHIHNDSYLRASAAIKTIMNSLPKDPSSKQTTRYSLVGTSLGGMMAAYVAGDLASDISRSVIIVGAGNAEGVLAYSDQEKVVAQRRERMNYFGLTDQASYEQLLQQEITHDPLSVVGQIPSNSMFLITGNKDTTVPTPYQYELVARVASPRHLSLRGGHVAAILKAHLFHTKKIVRFVTETK